jgi:hypothetical protein
VDLDRHARRLHEVELELEALARPARERYQRLGTVGLYNLAAAEERLASVARDEATRRVHATAALAAQALGDRAALQAARTISPE